jgi:hypothetical protein
MNLQENISRIKSIMGVISENSEEQIKSTLFKILSKSQYVKKFDYLWSPNLITGAPIVYVKSLDEKEFFDENINVGDIISQHWPYGDKPYEKWKHLYYGLVYGYLIKHKESPLKLLIQVVRFDKSELPPDSSEFSISVNPYYQGEVDGETHFIDDEMINSSGIEDQDVIQNDFSNMGEKLKERVVTLSDVKLVFRYLDAMI